MDPQMMKQQSQSNQLLQQQQQTSQQQQDGTIDEVMQQLLILVRETQATDNIVQSNRELYENFAIHLQTRGRLLASIEYAQRSPQYAASLNQHRSDLTAIDKVLRQKAAELDRVRRHLVESHFNIFNRLIVLQDKTLYEFLPRWHYEQQLINNGVKIDPISLDVIQSYVEKIIDIIWRIKNQIKCLQLTLSDQPNVPFDTIDLDRFSVCINKALENLILNSFVVEKQPPQVMKTNSRFTATVRYLCGNKLNLQLINPTVKAIILSEANARTVIRHHKQLIENSWHQLESSYLSEQQLSAGNTNVPLAHQQQFHMVNTQGQYRGLYANPTDSSMFMNNYAPNTMTSSPEQSMTVDDQSTLASPAHQYIFHQPLQLQQSKQLQQQQQQQQQLPSQQQMPTHQQMQAQHQQPQHFQQNTSMTMRHQQFTNAPLLQSQYGDLSKPGLTEVGYNPDTPNTPKEFESSGEIVNSTNILEFQETSGHMVCNCRNMQLKKIKRAEKKGTESVMDEKFILMFFTKFRLADDNHIYSSKKGSKNKRGDLLFHILALSLPVVVIVHGNQEPHALATITWHNAFARPDDLLYQVPDKVTWRELGNVLSDQFRSNAGRGLSSQNLKYLASKVHRNRVDDDQVLISWIQFAKEQLSDKTFTFWEWFHSILKLTKEHLRDLCEADRIYGFIGKKGCIDLLLGSANSEPTSIGTFLLRYSETELGGISIAWVSNTSELSTLNPSLNDRVQILQRSSPTNSSSNVVMHLQPFVSKDLATRPLADRVRDLRDLVTLYPNIPKDEAFKSYYAHNVNPLVGISSEAYIPTELVTTIPLQYSASSHQLQAEPSTTPNSMSQSSPETCYSGGYLPNPLVTTLPPQYTVVPNKPPQNADSTITSGSVLQSSPETCYPEVIPMNEMIETEYPKYKNQMNQFTIQQ